MFIRNQLFLLATVMIVISGLSASAIAKSSTIINKDGYRVAIDWKINRNTLRVRGMIKEGKLCKRLNISLFLKNKKGGSVHIEESVSYHTRNGIQFKGSDDYYKMILPQNSGILVKPLFYYSTIPSHIERAIYTHS